MKDVRRRRLGLSMMLLVAWMMVLALEAPATAELATIGPWSVCEGAPFVPTSNCVRKPLQDIDPQGRILWLSAEVQLDTQAAEPRAVFVSAYASMAVYWDGKLVGMNGVPSSLPALEQPGLRDAV